MSGTAAAERLDPGELRAAVREVLAVESSSERVRERLEDPVGHDPKLWAAMGELGWLGLAVAEAHGGGGQGPAELGVLLSELGRHLTPSPFAWTAALGAGALDACQNEALREQELPALAAGERIVTAALCGPSGSCDVEELGIGFSERNGELRLSGAADFVPDAHVADRIVLLARGPGGELALAWADARDAALGIAPREGWDLTRRLCRVEVAELAVPASRLLARGEGAAALREHLLDRAALALACDSVGGAERVLETTVAYARERVQFDRPIGSFQAVKHRCADMLTAVETSRVATEHAGALAGTGDTSRARIAASEAKFHACDAYARVAGDGIQLHGGVGFTWEYDCHLFLKRAKLNQALWGDSAWHRDRVAGILL